MKSPVRWIGGKKLLAAEIVKLIPANHISYIEPCVGGGSVLFQKPRSKVEIANDSDRRLINFFRVVKEKPDELWKFLDLRLFHEEEFWNMVNLKPKNDVEDAGSWFYVNRTAFGGEVARPYWAPTVKLGGLHNAFSKLEEIVYGMHKRIRTVMFLCRPCIDVIELADADSIVYLDPPYFGTHGYKHDVDWERIIDWMGRTEARWILTINQCEFIDENVIPLADTVVKKNVQYSLSRDAKGRQKYGEYIITSFPIGKTMNQGKKVLEEDFSGTMFEGL